MDLHWLRKGPVHHRWQILQHRDFRLEQRSAAGAITHLQYCTHIFYVPPAVLKHVLKAQLSKNFCINTSSRLLVKVCQAPGHWAPTVCALISSLLGKNPDTIAILQSNRLIVEARNDIVFCPNHVNLHISGRYSDRITQLKLGLDGKMISECSTRD